MRSSASPISARALPAVTAVLALLCLAASPAFAGFGDLVKAAKNKAVQAAAPKSARAAGGGAESVEFTDEILELTSARLDQVEKGFAAAASITSGRPALVARRTQMESEAGALQERHGKAIDAASSRHSDAEQCWDHSLDARREARSSEMRDKMMADPAMREKMMAIGQRMSQAQAKGDAEGMRKAQDELLAISGPTHADSLAALQKCGPIPPLHPAAARIDSLRTGVRDTDDDIRAMDRMAIDQQAKASGLTPEQFAMAQERIELYLQSVRANANPHGFTHAELEALAAHRSALEAALGTSGSSDH